MLKIYKTYLQSAEKTIQYLKERGLNICPIRQ